MDRPLQVYRLLATARGRSPALTMFVRSPDNPECTCYDSDGDEKDDEECAKCPVQGHRYDLIPAWGSWAITVEVK
jgi:hypothetical protein